MALRDKSLLSDILEPEERAIESVVARYQRVAGAVTRFARSLTGREELRVILGADSRSSDNEVVIDPGLFQAAYSRRAPVTPEETALASALHEVVHLVSTNLDERRPLPPSWLPKDAEPPGDQELPLLDALDRAGGPPAEALFFAVEDARQERQSLDTYPGARSVLEDLYRASLTEAVASSGPLGQYSLACFMLVGGYIDRDTLERKIDARAAVALSDAGAFLAEVIQTTEPWDVAGLALQLLAVAKMHNLITSGSTTERQIQRQDHEESEKNAIAEGVDKIRLYSPVIQDAEGYDDTRKASEARAAQDGRTGDAEIGANEGTDQLIRVSQSPTVYLPSGQGGKLMVARVPERFRSFGEQGRIALMQAARNWKVDQHHISGELHPLFIANQRRGLRSGFDAGDLSPHAALLLGGGLYERMFERRSLSTRRSYAVSVLVDGSASMLQPRRLAAPGDRRPWGLSAAMLGAWTLAAMCNQLQIDFEVALFNRAFAAKIDDTEWSYSRRRTAAIAELRQSQGTAADRLTSTVNHYLLSTFNEPWRRSEDLLAGMFWAAAEPGEAGMAARRAPKDTPPVSLFEKAANVDEFNLAYAAERMAAHRAQVRVLVVLADGMTRGSVESLARSVEAVEAQGTTVLGIGIGDDTVETTYGRHQVVARPDELANSMVEGVRMALRRGLALFGEDTWWIRASQARSRVENNWSSFNTDASQKGQRHSA
jgi:hypothetical protein